MAYTLAQSVAFAQTFIQYSPLTVGTGNEPAVSIANEIQNTITNAPMVWPWNRYETTGISLTAGAQTYTVTSTDFSFMEKASLIAGDGSVYEILDVYNNEASALTSSNVNSLNRPNSCCVFLINYGANFQVRFMGAPDQGYNSIFTYQILITPITSPSSTWAIPDQYLDIYNNLFVGEAMAVVDDARAVQYRQRGIAALLAKQQGLSAMQKDAFLEQYWARDSQMLAKQQKTQQGGAARGV